MSYKEPDAHYNQLTQRVIGAAIEVHKALGPGYLESVYEEALTVEFKLRNIPFSRQYIIHVQYKNYHVGEGRLDFLVDNCLVLELKAIEEFLPIHTAQIMSYLKATKCRLGLLVNFNVPILRQGIKRIAL